MMPQAMATDPPARKQPIFQAYARAPCYARRTLCCTRETDDAARCLSARAHLWIVRAILESPRLEAKGTQARRRRRERLAAVERRRRRRGVPAPARRVEGREGGAQARRGNWGAGRPTACRHAQDP